MNPRLEAALKYEAAGFCPLPINESDKRPHFRLLSNGWEKFQKERPSREEITRWFLEYPQANIALLGGWGGLAFVDIDDPELAKGALQTPTLMSRTPRGGLHLWFKESHTSENAPVKKGVIDIKAAGGYVLVPPSRLPNGRYRFVNTLPLAPVPEARAWAVEFAKRSEVLAGNVPDESRKLYQEALEEERVSKGSRHDTFVSFLGKLRSVGMSREQLLVAAEVAYDRFVVETEGFSKEDARRTAEDIARRYDAPPTPESLKIVWNDILMSTPAKPTRWLINQIIPAGGIVYWAGDTGTYKSFLTLSALLSVSKGEGAWGHFPPSEGPFRSIYVDAENTEELQRERLELLWEKHVAPIRSVGFLDAQGFRLDDTLMKTILTEAKKCSAKFVVLDPLRDLFSGNENDSEAANTWNRTLSALKKEGIAVLVLHHVRKDTADDRFLPEGHKARGSTAFPAFADAYFMVKKSGQENVVLTQTKARRSQALRPFTIRVGNSENPKTLSFTYQGETLPDSVQKLEAACLLVLSSVEESPKPRQELLEQLSSQDTSPRTIDEALRVLAGSEKLAKWKERNPQTNRTFTVFGLPGSEPQTLLTPVE